MPRMDPKRKLEMGRRYALKEITIDEAVKEYGCRKSMVWDARKKWLESQPVQLAPADVAPTKPDRVDLSTTDWENAKRSIAELHDENSRLHDEVRTLQKIVMTLGRAL